MDPSSAWPRRGASTPRPPRGAQAARVPMLPPAPSRRRLVDPPSRPRTRNKVHLCHPPSACATAAPRPAAACGARGRAWPPLGCSPLPAWAWRAPEEAGLQARAAGPASLTSLPPRARHAGGQNRHRLLPGRSASPRPRRGQCTSLSGHSAGREAGERDDPSSPGMDVRERAPGLEWVWAAGFSSAEPPLTPLLHAPNAFPPKASPGAVLGFPQPRASPGPSPARGAELQVPAGPAPRGPEREAWLGPAPAQCGRPEPASTTPPGRTEGRQKHPKH